MKNIFREYHLIENNNYVYMFQKNGLKYFTFTKQEFEINVESISELLNDNLTERKKEYNINEVKENIEMVHLTINLSSSCNLRCKYCYIDKSDSNFELQFEDIKLFIEKSTRYFHDAKHFQVDVTGSGEPLLRFELIKDIQEYLKSISNEKTTYSLSFCTNGTMLSNEIIDYLESENIYYGVSMDGYRKVHDENRVYFDNKGTYSDILKNLKKINNQYIGAALTVTNKNLNLVKNLKTLEKNFDVTSMKLVRETDVDKGALTTMNLEQFKNAYTDLYNFLLKETLSMRTKYLIMLLSGEDLFGRFLKRVFINQSALTRCNAGISKFALENDKKVYICGAAGKNKEFQVGSLDVPITDQNVEYYMNHQVNDSYCDDCYAKNICGGICMVYKKQLEQKNMIKNRSMCELKKHIIQLVLSFRHYIYTVSPNLYQSIIGLCLDKHNI